MRKNYIHLVLLLLLNVSMFGQKVTISPTLINGMGYSGGSINLGSVPTTTVSLSVKVDVPSSAAAGNQGTIKIYFSRGTALASNVTNGGDGGALYFGGGNVATRSFVIELNWSDFLTSGGFIYAEYNNGTAYKSSNITVIKNSTVNTGTNLNPPKDAPNPKNIANTICCDQTIRLGEKPEPITGSQYLNPYGTLPYGIASVWETTARSPISFDNINKTLSIDYITEPGDITIKRSLGYYHNFEPVNKSNTVKIKVLPSPISNNEIFSNGSVNLDGSIEISYNNPVNIFGYQSFINLNMLQDPYYIPKRGETSIMIEKYEWEYRITNGTTEENIWTSIPNQFSASINSSYLPRSNSSKDNFYIIRRIAIYQNLKLTSNSLTISLRAIRENNTICCDQTLQISSSNEIEIPSIITGTTAISNKNKPLSYQWQSRTFSERDSKFSSWVNIPNSNSKDYIPPALEVIPGIGRNPATVPTYNYRRIATDTHYKGEEYYSNEISLTPVNNVNTSIPLIIYPNPATSIINIENTEMLIEDYLKDPSIDIVNIMGNVVNSNNFTKITPYLISIDISNLINGTYFINISSKNQDRRRGYKKQFTFIKNQ
ncbi:T9SS type A sorting domain-containing protein [Flavobacterium sp. LM4]|uniref:T9SS type A sorting domain-containing protein n=1 Tax=Flavobacterium sp. LM4 TaxID=1938609 RepID=UPI000991C3E1|nr:T9SS type A sorting domain-containing protein [Flavobacterium sp. LM4]OOV16509.1 secretion protein [Flavobacterium sp. LM4]